MNRQSPCRVCGRSTRKFLFNDRTLGIPVCSYGCEHKYLDSLSGKEEARLLSCLDDMISETKRHHRLIWASAGAGVLVILLGFAVQSAEVFITGVLVASVCALFTRYFEERVAKLTRSKERVQP